MRNDVLGVPVAVRMCATLDAPQWLSLVYFEDADLWCVVREVGGHITVCHRGVDPTAALNRANALLGEDAEPFDMDEIASVIGPGRSIGDDLWT